jgi:hypothetical protein
MDIDEIIAKLGRGETLTKEETAALKGVKLYTQAALDDEANARATSARKKAEKKAEDAEAARAALQTEVDALREKTDDSRWAKEKTRLENENADLKKKVGDMEAASAKATRAAKVGDILRKVGFVDKDARGNVLLSEPTARAIVEHALAEVETADMDREAVVNPVLERIRKENPHLIAASSSGSGRRPNVSIPNVYTGPNPWAKDTFNLSQQGIIARHNPDLAKQLAEAAGGK